MDFNQIPYIILEAGIYTNSKSKRYFCWRRCRLPQRMYTIGLIALSLAASISSLI
jgi:hypothetical protein